ncbi:winged helix-turn-helix transcriptional regulator [Herbaspirillum huttiense]|uniref:winged helix-turn-helix transcriptional regulator n=1 Tax=Herbaspirillum huttiense TaxID=863372 RepID=UPI0035C7795F
MKLVIESKDWPKDWCPVEHAISHLDGKWTVLILRELFRDGNCRFRELQRRLGNLSPRTLTDRLNRLETQGLIRRVETAGYHCYVLTDRGGSLAPVLHAMISWSIEDLSESDRNNPSAWG